MATDLADPTPTFVATTVAGFATPASGVTVNWNRASDLNTVVTGLQVNLRARVTVSGFGGGSLTSLPVGGQTVTPGSPDFAVAVTSTSLATDLLSATLPEGASQVVLMSAVDAAGNTTSTSFTYSADTVPPADVALSISATNRRRPSVTLDWTAVADDGATGTAAA